MNLREKIEACLTAEPDTAKAASMILAMLDHEGLDIIGNGWLDDDPLLMVDGDTTEAFDEASDQWEALAEKEEG